MLYDKEFLLKLDKSRNKTIYARITALNFNELPIETIEGRITGGSINIDGASSVRRTCSLTMVAQDFDYSDYYWGLKTKFKLEIGVQNLVDAKMPDIIWFKQGIYVISGFNTSQSTNGFNISISGKDKMCLLNGEIGGSLESAVDFGQIEEEDANGNWVIRKIAIPEIIRNMIHTYAHEPYHNIVINDLDTYGLELLEYRYEKPMYLYREKGSEVIDNAFLEDETKDIYLSKNINGQIVFNQEPTKLTDVGFKNLDLMVEGMVGVYEPLPVRFSENGPDYILAKVEQGQTAGYRKTELTYAGDLIANVGEAITSVLDKIKNMLAEFEYFYNLDGQFVFQKKQSFISSMWSPSSGTSDVEELPEYLALASTHSYVFSGSELIKSFNNNPQIGNMKNDYSIWGQKGSKDGAAIHLRYVIDNKPTEYNSIIVGEDEVAKYNMKYGTKLKPQLESKKYVSSNAYAENGNTINCDWREVIYQMSRDYYRYNFLEDFELRIIEKNPQLYPTGQTGYESYYIDLNGFWRGLYYPKIDTELDEITREYDELKSSVEALEKEVFGTEVDYSANKVGGIQEDVVELNNMIQDNEDTSAFIEDIDKKYNFKDDNDNQVREESLYLRMLQQHFFERKSQLETEQYKLSQLESKKKSLELNVKENYYISTDENQVEKSKEYWNKSVYESPYTLNFWFDFLDTDGELNKYNVKNIGSRAKAVNDTNVKSIYFRETPSVVFQNSKDFIYKPINVESYKKDTYYYYDSDKNKYMLDKSENIVENRQYYIGTYETLSGYKHIRVPNIEHMFTISGQGKSAKDKLDELLYQHSYCLETSTVTTIPIYYLQPNTRVLLYDENVGLNGDYIISKISLPLAYNGTMSLTVTKSAENII